MNINEVMVKLSRTWIVIICLLAFGSCGPKEKKQETSETDQPKEMSIAENLKWSERMALSIMKRNPEAWQIDDAKKPLMVLLRN